MQCLCSTLFTFQLSSYKSLPEAGAPEPNTRISEALEAAKAPVARMSEAQLVGDEIV